MTAGRRGRRGRLDWQSTGQDDHFAGDPYFARWLDDPDDSTHSDDSAGAAGHELWPRRRDVLTPDVAKTAPRWWRIWRWWR
jgi:hypothetical protein